MGFKNTSEIIKFKDQNNQPKTKTITEQFPFLEYVSTFDVMFDPTAPSFYKSKYVIRRRVSHIEDIKERYSSFIKNFEPHLKSVADASSPIFARDYNRIKFALIQNEDKAEMASTSQNNGNSHNAGDDINLDFLSASVKNQLTINYE